MLLEINFSVLATATTNFHISLAYYSLLLKAERKEPRSECSKLIAALIPPTRLLRSKDGKGQNQHEAKAIPIGKVIAAAKVAAATTTTATATQQSQQQQHH